MCLDSLIETNTKITEGYKLFDHALGYITCLMYGGFRVGKNNIHDDICDKIPKCRWLSAYDDTKILMQYGGDYPSGFHFFQTLPGALEYGAEIGDPYIIHKIKVRDVVASGYQCPLELRCDKNIAHVARQMFVMNEVYRSGY